MAFIDRVVEHPGRVTLTAVDGETDVYDVERQEGEVYTAGTLLNATNLNKQTQLDADVRSKFETVGMVPGTNDNYMSDALDMIVSGAFVTESGRKQGGEGNTWWGYRKWSDGTIEMWGTAALSTQTPQLFPQSNGMYYVDVSFTWPSDIFDSTPSGVIASGNNFQWVTVGISGLTTTGASARLLRPNNAAQAVSLKIYAFRYPNA